MAGYRHADQTVPSRKVTVRTEHHGGALVSVQANDLTCTEIIRRTEVSERLDSR